MDRNDYIIKCYRIASVIKAWIKYHLVYRSHTFMVVGALGKDFWFLSKKVHIFQKPWTLRGLRITINPWQIRMMTQ